MRREGREVRRERGHAGRWVVVAFVALAGGCGKEGPSGEAGNGSDVGGVAIIRAEDATAPTPAEGPLRDKLLELAVAGECLRRSGVDPEAAVAAMDALYRGHGIALDVYAKEMSVLSADSRFGAAVEERLTRCAGVVAALVPGGVGVDAANAANGPDAVGDTVVAQVVDVPPVQDTQDTGGGQADVGGPIADVVAVVDVVEPGPKDVVAAPDAVVEAPDVVGEVKVEPKPAPRYAGTWSGTISGTASGTLRVTVQGSRVTGAAAAFGRSTLRLKGSISDKGVLALGGTAGDEFIRMSGKLERSGQAIGGTWDGVIDRKRSSGKFRIAR